MSDLSIWIHLCCNDPDSGRFTGEATAMHVGDGRVLALDALWWDEEEERFRGPKLERVRTKQSGIVLLRIAHDGRTSPDLRVVRYANWVGNWCWDAALVPAEDVLWLLNWQPLRKLFSLDEAEPRLYRAWEDGQTFDESHLRIIANTEAYV